MSIAQLIVVGAVAGIVAWIVGGVRARHRPIVVCMQVTSPTIGRKFGCLLWAVIGLAFILLLGMLQR